MAAYIPLIYHVIVVLIGLLLGLYAGITVRGILKLRLYQIPKKKEKKSHKKSGLSFKENPPKKKRNRRTKRQKAKPQKEKMSSEKDTNITEPEKTSNKSPRKKRDLKSCLYDKNDSWTDFNCTLDGEDNDDVIKKNRRGQDNAYNIIKRKRRSKK